MLDKILLLNRDETINEVYMKSQDFIKTNSEKLSRFGDLFYSLYGINDIMPVFTGNVFPLTQAYFNLETSYHLAIRGFYTTSLIVLRSVLETGIASVYYLDHKEEFEKWLVSEIDTHSFKKMLDNIYSQPDFSNLEKIFHVKTETIDVFKKLCNFTHGKGREHSTFKYNKSNVINYQENSLETYFNYVKEVIYNVLYTILTKYPTGIIQLPIEEENVVSGGYVMGDTLMALKSILKDDFLKFLQDIIDRDGLE